MDNDTIVKIVLGSFGLVLLALNIIKDMVKNRNDKAPPDEEALQKERKEVLKPVLAAIGNLKDNTDAIALLVKDSTSGAITLKDAENLLAINARDQHEGFFKQIPCFGRDQCTKTVRELFKELENDTERRFQYISDQLAAIITALNKIYGAKTGRHTEPAIKPHGR